MVKYDLKLLQDNITDEQLFSLMAALGADEYIDKGDIKIFPTICHNTTAATASMKLYYYKSNKRFHCYTECGDTFNIFELINRVFELRGYKNGAFSFSDVLNYFLDNTGIKGSTVSEVPTERYHSISNKYSRKNRILKLEKYDKGILNVFVDTYAKEWIEEGISIKAMKKFDIKFSISQNKIIIPHYDVDENLIGIRGRALNEDEIELYGKYMPVKIENKLYAHPLSQNLYGINNTAAAIKKSGIAILYEGEKSVLLHETYFDINNSVAVCGSNFNKVQLDLLLNTCKPKEIVIAFDKEYDKPGTIEGEKYFNKLKEICLKYQNYCNMSFIYDSQGLLKRKDSPIDCGKDIFLKLYTNRTYVKGN